MLLHLDQIDSKLSTKHSAVGGTVYLQIGEKYFPEENWYDYASYILEQWIPAILSFSRGSVDSCKLTFYDGPCYARLLRNADSTVTVACVYDKKTVIEETVIDFRVFANSVIKAGNRFCRLLHLQGRTDPDIAASLEKLKIQMRTVENTGPC